MGYTFINGLAFIKKLSYVIDVDGDSG